MRNRTGIERLQKLKKLPSLDKYLIFSFSVLIVYSIIELILSTVFGISHDTLTTCLYAAFGGEILCCAVIKKFKLQKGE